jgi:hypothetical protein
MTALWLVVEVNPQHCCQLLMDTVMCCAGQRLEEWTIVRLWFGGRFFDSAEDLAHAWEHDTKGLKSNFRWEAPGVCVWGGG